MGAFWSHSFCCCYFLHCYNLRQLMQLLKTYTFNSMQLTKLSCNSNNGSFINMQRGFDIWATEMGSSEPIVHLFILMVSVCVPSKRAKCEECIKWREFCPYCRFQYFTFVLSTAGLFLFHISFLSVPTTIGWGISEVFRFACFTLTIP